MSAYPPSRFGGWAKARRGGPSSVLPALRLVDRPLGIMDDSRELRLCPLLNGTQFQFNSSGRIANVSTLSAPKTASANRSEAPL